MADYIHEKKAIKNDVDDDPAKKNINRMLRKGEGRKYQNNLF